MYALYELGHMYRTGYGTKVNYKKAMDCFLKAADQGYDEAQAYIAEMYEKGEGVKQDYNKAIEWYLKAAKQGNEFAQFTLASIYENGLTGTKDYKKAMEFYEQSAAQGNENAKKNLAELKSSSQKNPMKQNTSSINPNSAVAIKDNVIPQGRNTGNKPTITIRAFDDVSEERNAPADAIMHMMVTDLHKSGDFNLVERERIDYIKDEITLGQSGLVDLITAPEIGKIVGAKYIMTGAITLYYYNEKGSGLALPIIGAAAKAKTAYVVIDIRIFDASTGLIVYADTQTGEATQKSKTSIGGKAKTMIGGLLSMATQDAVKKHVSAIKKLNLELL